MVSDFGQVHGGVYASTVTAMYLSVYGDLKRLVYVKLGKTLF